jgi:hypothetical protein
MIVTATQTASGLPTPDERFGRRGSDRAVAGPRALRRRTDGQVPMDMAEGVPEDYHDAMNTFFTRAAESGSPPQVTSDVIYRAVTDGLDGKVRYYSGPDGEIIPRAKSLLGPEWYWHEFRESVVHEPSDLWKSLNAAPGSDPLEMTR